jgi:hypothetical protein
MAHRWMYAIAICTALSSQATAAEQPKPRFFARISCTVVRYYAAKYTVDAAEQWARSKGATEGEIETARHCLKEQTAQGPSKIMPIAIIGVAPSLAAY